MRNIALVLCLLTNSATALDKGQYENVDPKIREWFRGIRSPHGIPCCDIADGHSTTWRKSETDGHEYDVPIEGIWYPVPNEAIINNANNPTGETIVWYVRSGTHDYYIRCFVPGNGA